MTSSGACACNTGYSGLDCGKCALGYSREGMRCVLESKAPCCFHWSRVCFSFASLGCVYIAGDSWLRLYVPSCNHDPA